MLQADAIDDQVGANPATPLLASGEGTVTAATESSMQSRIARVISQIPDVRKLIRYGSTSVIALVISEITLVLLFAYHVVGATTAALLANISGTVPSYLLSRYWIWASADRKQPGRQVAFYWIVSVISMVISSFATGFIAHHTARQHILHLAEIAGSYFLISGVLWLAKYVVYERTIFKTKAEPVAV